MKNKLSAEKSPYLLQHEDNPVWWWAWGAEAFAAAKAQNKPIFLSIGYATCHWCHVMAHECFESEEIARLLNDGFIAIKLDREERPDIDDIYMTAVQMMVGQGGWPLSVWLTPEGRPFYGGTYFPKPTFSNILTKITETWSDKPHAIADDALALMTHLNTVVATTPNSSLLDKADLDSIFKNFIESHEQRFDSVHGGFGSAPKFPQTMNLMVLLRRHSLPMVETTLDAMARGGMYDHLMGGFHRYSTDGRWCVPHFEKMLYDQACLAQIYFEGYQVFKKPEWARVAREILCYVLDEMTSPEGGFYSAQDADSFNEVSGEREEGYFATFTWVDLSSALSPSELKQVEIVYGISQHGNFEGRNILELQIPFDRTEKDKNFELKSAFEKLKALRNARPQPLTDDKILCAWNGWMISALVKGYQVLQEPEFLTAAIRSAEFVVKQLFVDQKLYRRFREDERKGSALSDDYAAMVAAFLDLYETTGVVRWFDNAKYFQQLQDDLFWDIDYGGYFRDDGKDLTLILRIKEDHDGVRPSANSLSMLNLLRLFHLDLNYEYKAKAEKLLLAFKDKLIRHPLSLPFMMVSLDFYLKPIKEIVLNGWPDTLAQNKFLEDLFATFCPSKVLAQIQPPIVDGPTILEGRNVDSFSIFVCEEGVCHSPHKDGEAALKAIMDQI